MNTNPRDPEILKKLFVEVKPSDAANTGKPKKPSLVSIRSMNPKSRTSLEKRKCIVSKSYEYIFGSYEVKSGKANFLFYFDHVYMEGGVTRLGGLPGLPGRVILSAGVTICHVNLSRWGNPPSRGRVHSKKLKSKTCMF